MRFITTLALVATSCSAYVVTPPAAAIPANDIAKRSPFEVEGEINALVARNEVALYERDLDNELAPAKQYDIDIADSTDLSYSHPFISASVFTVTGALSFSSLVTGCVGVGSANPIASYSCAASIAATSISFLSALYHTYQGFRSIRATLRNNNVSIGLRHVKRDGEEMTLSHEEYMEYIMHATGLNGTHIGYHQRDNVEYTTPVYSFPGEDGRNYHLTISPDSNGEVKHTLSFAEDSTLLEKRQGYQGVRVNGGLDLDACQRTSGDQGDNPGSAKSAYSYIYRDFTCLVGSSKLLNGNYVQSDLMDRDGKTVLTMGMAPYKSGQADYVTKRPYCSNDPFYFSQSCIN